MGQGALPEYYMTRNPDRGTMSIGDRLYFHLEYIFCEIAMVQYVCVSIKLSWTCCSTQMGWPLEYVTGCGKKQPIIAYGPVSIAKLDHCPWWSSRSDEWNKRAASVYIIYGVSYNMGTPIHWLSLEGNKITNIAWFCNLGNCYIL